MEKPIVRIYTGNGEFIDREMTDDEYEQHLKDTLEAENKKVEVAKKTEERNQLLKRLGITTDEARLLLG